MTLLRLQSGRAGRVRGALDRGEHHGEALDVVAARRSRARVPRLDGVEEIGDDAGMPMGLARRSAGGGTSSSAQRPEEALVAGDDVRLEARRRRPRAACPCVPTIRQALSQLVLAPSAPHEPR